MVWIFVVAGIYQGTTYTASLALVGMENNTYDPVSKLSFVQITGFYAFMVFVTLFYPVSGFIADVYSGRYRMVTISLGIIFLALILVCIDVVLFKVFYLDKRIKEGRYNTSLYVIAYTALLVAIPGLSGFYANISQLSLDQLQDAPSNSLGVCLHWIAWSNQLGKAVVHVLFVVETCTRQHPKLKNIIRNVALCLPSSFLVLLSILIVVNCFAKRWFHTEFVRYNPYKMISKVLNYARKNKHARWRSALHCNGNRIPTRLDFAKDIYGGPFTTPDVEDVKTFLRVFVVLLAIGPVYVLCVPTSYYLFPIYSFHTVGRSDILTSSCTVEWTLFESGTLSELLALVVIPVVIWFVYAVKKNRVPKIFTRLGISMVVFILSVFSMLLPDLIGHVLQSDRNDSFVNETQCMFIENYFYNNPQKVVSLQLPWYVLIIPNCLMRVAECLVLATSSEFISAQTPQSMKGVLFGVFFAIKGLFTFLGAVLLIPFALPFWREVHSPIVNCGFGYFLLTSVIAVVGFVSYVCVVRRYRYRERDNEPFCQAAVEEIFSRRLEHEHRLISSPELIVEDPPQDDRRLGHGRGCIVTGGGASQHERGSSRDTNRVDKRMLSLSHNWYGTFDDHGNGVN